MILPLLLVLLPACDEPTPGDDAQEQESSLLRRYDLRPVMPSFDRSGWTQSMVLSPAVHDDDWEVDLQELHEAAAPDAILDLLTQVLGDELHYEGRGIALEAENQLVVLAPESTQAKVRGVLGELRRTLSGSIEVQLDVLTFEDETGGIEIPGTLLPAAEAARLIDGAVAAGAAHEEQTFQLAPGRTAGLDQMAAEPFVMDYDVEIASEAQIFDPSVVDARHGLRVLLRGAPSTGGVALSAMILSGELLGGVMERPLSVRGSVGDEDKGGITLVEGPTAVQAVDILTRSVAFETFLPDGQALVAHSEADLRGKRGRQVIVLRRLGGGSPAYVTHRIEGTSRSLILLNTELFLGVPRLGISGSATYDDWRHPTLIASMQAEPALFLFDWMKYRFDVWRRLGPWVVIVTDPAWDGEGARELSALVGQAQAAPRLLQVDVDLRAQGLGAERPVHWSLPVREGSSCGIVLGIAGTAITDFDVEVAQASAVPDPEAAATFHGLALEIEIAGGAGDTWLVGLDGAAHLITGPIETFTPGSPTLGRLEQPRTESLVLDERRSVPHAEDGARVFVGTHSRNAGQRSLGLEVVVR